MEHNAIDVSAVALEIEKAVSLDCFLGIRIQVTSSAPMR